MKNSGHGDLAKSSRFTWAYCLIQLDPLQTKIYFHHVFHQRVDQGQIKLQLLEGYRNIFKWKVEHPTALNRQFIQHFLISYVSLPLSKRITVFNFYFPRMKRKKRGGGVLTKDRRESNIFPATTIGLIESGDFVSTKRKIHLKLSTLAYNKWLHFPIQM